MGTFYVSFKNYCLFLGCAVFAGVYGNCIQEIAQTQEYMDCINGYMTYMQNLPSDPEAIIAFSCR